MAWNCVHKFLVFFFSRLAKRQFTYRMWSHMKSLFLSAAKDQGITWVVVFLVHHLVNFLFKINLREKNYPFLGIESGTSRSSRALYQLSYSEIETQNIENYLLKDILYNCTKIIYLMISKTTPQTSRQSWPCSFNLDVKILTGHCLLVKSNLLKLNLFSKQKLHTNNISWLLKLIRICFILNLM